MEYFYIQIFQILRTKFCSIGLTSGALHSSAGQDWRAAIVRAPRDRCLCRRLRPPSYTESVGRGLTALARRAQCSRGAEDEPPAVGGAARRSQSRFGDATAGTSRKFPPPPPRTEFRDKKAVGGRLGICVESGQ